MASLRNLDRLGMKEYCPRGKDPVDDEMKEEVPPRRDRGEVA